jgi:protein-tyrosine-phosphatase
MSIQNHQVGITKQSMSVSNKKILFICFANKSRSPMAKGLAQKMFPSDFYVDSAGVDSEACGGANYRAISVMGEYGVDLMSHLAKSITDVALSDFDHVIAMDSDIFDSIIKAHPGMQDRTIQWQIEDPFYGTVKTYRRCAEEIFQNLKVLLTTLGLSELSIYPSSDDR